MYKKILLAYDGSAGAKLALSHAIPLAKALGARLAAIWARGSLPHYPETVDEIAEETEAADQYFARLRKGLEATAQREGIEVPCERRIGHPAKTILTYAEEGGFDLIVLGSRGHSELWGRIMGHTANRVSEHAHCDVLVVKPPEPVRGDLPDAYALTDDLADEP